MEGQLIAQSLRPVSHYSKALTKDAPSDISKSQNMSYQIANDMHILNGPHNAEEVSKGDYNQEQVVEYGENFEGHRQANNASFNVFTNTNIGQSKNNFKTVLPEIHQLHSHEGGFCILHEGPGHDQMFQVRVFDGDYSQSKEEAYQKFQHRQKMAHSKDILKKMSSQFQNVLQPEKIGSSLRISNKSKSPSNLGFDDRRKSITASTKVRTNPIPEKDEINIKVSNSVNFVDDFRRKPVTSSQNSRANYYSSQSVVRRPNFKFAFSQSFEAQKQGALPKQKQPWTSNRYLYKILHDNAQKQYQVN